MSEHPWIKTYPPGTRWNAPLRTLAEIRADILALEQQSEGLLHKIVGVEK